VGTNEIETRTLTEQSTAVCLATLPVADIGPWLSGAYGRVAGLLGAQAAGPAGPPFARYHLLGDERFEIEAGFPSMRPVEPSDEVKASSLPGGPAAFVVHIGPYDEMGPAYEALTAWMRDRGVEPNGDKWEVYLSDPVAEPDPSTWRTEIYAPYVER
jgi:effector-binding domain-containing protein